MSCCANLQAANSAVFTTISRMRLFTPAQRTKTFKVSNFFASEMPTAFQPDQESNWPNVHSATHSIACNLVSTTVDFLSSISNGPTCKRHKIMEVLRVQNWVTILIVSFIFKFTIWRQLQVQHMKYKKDTTRGDQHMKVIYPPMSFNSQPTRESTDWSQQEIP